MFGRYFMVLAGAMALTGCEANTPAPPAPMGEWKSYPIPFNPGGTFSANTSIINNTTSCGVDFVAGDGAHLLFGMLHGTALLDISKPGVIFPEIFAATPGYDAVLSSGPDQLVLPMRSLAGRSLVVAPAAMDPGAKLPRMIHAGFNINVTMNGGQVVYAERIDAIPPLMERQQLSACMFMGALPPSKP